MAYVFRLKGALVTVRRIPGARRADAAISPARAGNCMFDNQPSR